MSLLKTALTEENDALHTAQADLNQRQTKTTPTAAAKKSWKPSAKCRQSSAPLWKRR